MTFTENMLKQFAAPLSATEEVMCKNAIAMVRDALKKLGFTDDGKEIKALYDNTSSYSIEMRNPTASRKIKIFVQGSYANNTNVRTQSDVDIAVVQEEIFRTRYRENTYLPQCDADYGFVTVPRPAKSFKDEVQACLIEAFGEDVERKNKSIKVHGNTYRKDADTVPSFRLRDYTNDYEKNPENYVGGIAIVPDDGSGTIINYPEQHILNGKRKNEATHFYYKKMVRILKKMRYLMKDDYYSSADRVSSFALESLLWNLPDDLYIENGIYRMVFAFDHLIEYVRRHYQELSGFKEANGIKDLFKNESEQNDMKSFFEDLREYYSFT